MNKTRIALYIGNSLYPSGVIDPDRTVEILQNSPLTSPILSLLNQNADNPEQLVFNDGTNPVFNNKGEYIGKSEWKNIVQRLRGGNINELYISFSTNGVEYMDNLISTNTLAAQNILNYIKNDLGFDGIDLDYEGGDMSQNSPIYSVALLAIKCGLNLTAAPYSAKEDWQSWVDYVQKNEGIVSWLNLQCYAGGTYNNPGEWLDIKVPIVAGTCNNCCCPQTKCSPNEMEELYSLWRTGMGNISTNCWRGVANKEPQELGGAFIWTYSSIKDSYLNYMNALKNGLGI
jgi:hypothetical protein